MRFVVENLVSDSKFVHYEENVADVDNFLMQNTSISQMRTRKRKGSNMFLGVLCRTYSVLRVGQERKKKFWQEKKR